MDIRLGWNGRARARRRRNRLGRWPSECPGWRWGRCALGSFAARWDRRWGRRGWWLGRPGIDRWIRKWVGQRRWKLRRQVEVLVEGHLRLGRGLPRERWSLTPPPGRAGRIDVLDRCDLAVVAEADDGLNHGADHATGQEDDDADHAGADVASPPGRAPAKGAANASLEGRDGIPGRVHRAAHQARHASRIVGGA